MFFIFLYFLILRKSFKANYCILKNLKINDIAFECIKELLRPSYVVDIIKEKRNNFVRWIPCQLSTQILLKKLKTQVKVFLL